MKKATEAKKQSEDAERILRNGKLPDTDLTHLRHKTWQLVLSTQRERRAGKSFLRLPPWIWALASLVLILLLLGVILLWR